jgi:hypothetical protein
MKPDYPNHKNPALSTIFDIALSQVTEILAKWDNSHSTAINSFEAFSLNKKKHARARETGNWMLEQGLYTTPELEAVLSDPLVHVMGHDTLLGLTQHERGIRALGVGSVLFQLLAVQYELGEPLNLNRT